MLSWDEFKQMCAGAPHDQAPACVDTVDSTGARPDPGRVAHVAGGGVAKSCLCVGRGFCPPCAVCVWVGGSFEVSPLRRPAVAPAAL